MGHADLAVCTRGRGAAVITVGQKDCACVHRRGGFRDRLPSHGRGICFYRVGDYQIAPIAVRSTAMGRWRLTPPGYGGICLPAGRSAGLTGHRRVIQYRGPLKGKANGGVSFNTANHQGEALGDKKKRPGALLLALFISFWQCRSGPSGTGATGRRRGLRRGRRSWENPWHRRP